MLVPALAPSPVVLNKPELPDSLLRALFGALLQALLVVVVLVVMLESKVSVDSASAAERRVGTGPFNMPASRKV